MWPCGAPAATLPPVPPSRHARDTPTPAERALSRVARTDWEQVGEALDAWGHARLPGLLTAADCRALARLYDAPEHFRKRVDLARHRFGDRGDYQYFARPLPPLVDALRAALYPPLARIANRWNRQLRSSQRYPDELDAFSRRCRAAGQPHPTPLLLRYADGGYNRLHQDLYGEIAFPLQVTVLLSEPGKDFRGGEFLLTESSARMQSRGDAVALARGEAVVFPTRERPVAGARGYRRATMRHGVSRIEGSRMALGLIFHDAKS